MILEEGTDQQLLNCIVEAVTPEDDSAWSWTNGGTVMWLRVVQHFNLPPATGIMVVLCTNVTLNYSLDYWLVHMCSLPDWRQV